MFVGVMNFGQIQKIRFIVVKIFCSNSNQFLVILIWSSGGMCILGLAFNDQTPTIKPQTSRFPISDFIKKIWHLKSLRVVRILPKIAEIGPAPTGRGGGRGGNGQFCDNVCLRLASLSYIKVI